MSRIETIEHGSEDAPAHTTHPHPEKHDARLGAGRTHMNGPELCDEHGRPNGS